jgi:hypothetical protein
MASTSPITGDTMAKSVSIPDFLTPDQIEAAQALYKKFKNTGRFATECAKQIIEPNMKEINRKLGQENDPKYLAYACEYVFGQLGL